LRDCSNDLVGLVSLGELVYRVKEDGGLQFEFGAISR